MKLTIQKHCGLVTVLVTNRVICQFPEEQGKRFEFPWTVCPAWLSWGIGGAYNYVLTSDELLQLIREFLDRVTEQMLIDNWEKLEWEFGPVVRNGAAREVSLVALDFGPLPIPEGMG